MKLCSLKSVVTSIFLVLFTAGYCFAHFGMVIPSDSMVMQDDDTEINIDLSFSHPFEGHGMELVKPDSFFVVHQGKKENLLNKLTTKLIMDHKSWTTEFAVKRPGTYAFCMIPKPYWEPAEDCFIIHYTKTVVAAFGSDEGWDNELGLKTEIVPLSKPFALYAGNLFQGIVKLDGKAVPYAEVEVEYYNKKQKAKAPSDYMVTQTIKADKNGVFSYAPPVAGWWGFAALNSSDKKMVHNQEKKDIELGAVLWVEFHSWKTDQ